MGRKKLEKNIPKRGVLFRCKYGHVRCKGGEPCENAMKFTGRPSDWEPHFNHLLIEFFKTPPVKEWVRSTTTKFDKDTGKKTQEKIDKAVMPAQVPFFGAFEREHKLTHGALSRWAAMAEKEEGRFPGFLDAYHAAKELQKEFLIQLGMSGLTPSGSYSFTAKNLTDMRDKHELGGPDGSPITFGWAGSIDDDKE